MDILKQLIAKTNTDTSSEWLPLWMHACDTAGIMDMISRCWLPDSVRSTLENSLPSNSLNRISRFVGYIHDIGKATAVFQAKIGNQLPYVAKQIYDLGVNIPPYDKFTVASQSPHALAGEAILLSRGCPLGIASVVGSHHGKPRTSTSAEEFIEIQFKSCGRNYFGDNGRKDPARLSLKKSWESVWDKLINDALDYSGYRAIQELPDIDIPTQVLISGMLIMADWIASNTTYFPLIAVDETKEMDCYPSRVETAWEEINLPEGWSPQSYFMNDDQFKDTFAFYPNQIQKTILREIESCSEPGIFILEAPMGTGKTEAAIAAAEVLASRNGADGVFFGLPTQATANGIFPRLEKWAEKQSEYELHAIRLAHGMAELNTYYQSLFHGRSNCSDEEESLLIVHQWFEGRKQALLANFVIGTVDQFLMSALKQKHVMLRHLGLAGKIIIIDECHAYDAYMNEYLDRALNWMGTYKVPVIILSATLPPNRRTSLIESYLHNTENYPPKNTDWKTSSAYPLLTWTDGVEVHQSEIETHDIKSKNIFISTLSDEMVEISIKDALADGGCAGIIVNTVKRAQIIAQSLKEALPGSEVLLIHSHFIHPDRAQKEKLLLERIGKGSTPEIRNGLIVVGTQVLEQSLDIDFDFMITDLCPMDLLLQRIGRLHRHNDRPRPARLTRPQCCVLGASGDLDKGSEYIYKSWLLLKTRELLPEKITIPDDITPLVHQAYKDPDTKELEDKAKQDAWNKQTTFVSEKQRKASGFLLAAPFTSSRYQTLNSLAGLLENDVTDHTKDSEAAVRDGSNPLTVLVLMHHANDTISFLPWQNNGKTIERDRVPSADVAKQILLQQIHLPSFLSKRTTILELETESKRLVPEWQYSGWLKDELFLFLDENQRAEINAETNTYILAYDQSKGLIYDKKESSESC